MRIALIRREYITHLDGVNRFIAWLAEGLHKLGHDTILASWCYSEQVPKEELEQWFREKHGLDFEIPIYTLRKEPCRGDPWAKMLWEWWTQGSTLLKRLDIDIVIVNGVTPLRFKPKIVVAHGIHRSPSSTERLILKILYSTYDTVICVSEVSHTEYKGITECRYIIPLPIKLELYKPSTKREDIIVHIGTRLIKNPHISIETVEKLREKGLNAELYIIGARTLYVEKLAKNKPYVHLMFDADEKEKIDILCRAKALVLPSSGEAFSFTAVESMACGTPPIVSSAVPSDVVIHGVNGLRVITMNPIDYANAIASLFSNEKLWATLSKGGQEFAKRFDYIEIAKKYAKILSKLRTHEEEHY